MLLLFVRGLGSKMENTLYICACGLSMRPMIYLDHIAICETYINKYRAESDKLSDAAAERSVDAAWEKNRWGY
jgi:hypothetical protein